MTDDAESTDLAVARRILAAVWPDSTAEPLVVSENATFRVRGGPHPAVLRLHRPHYQNDAAIASELAWIAALRRDTDVAVVEPLRAGAEILVDQRTGRRAVLFGEVPGGPIPDAGLDAEHFAALGAVAAVFHDHAARWPRPAEFARFHWDIDNTIGGHPRWGDWRANPAVTPEHRRRIEPASARAIERISAFGHDPDRFGLIHGDLRAANLIADPARPGAFTVIDFDDSGFGWHLFEFAAAASFVETDPRLPHWARAWADAYRTRRPLPADHAALLPDFVLARRLQLLGWLGTHGHAIESDPDFADGTVDVAEKYLRGELL